jgi:hypothetical protein
MTRQPFHFKNEQQSEHDQETGRQGHAARVSACGSCFDSAIERSEAWLSIYRICRIYRKMTKQKVESKKTEMGAAPGLDHRGLTFAPTGSPVRCRASNAATCRHAISALLPSLQPPATRTRSSFPLSLSEHS